MDKDKHVIWNNDSIAHDGQEECIKEDWIYEVQAAFGLCESNDIPIPSGLLDAVKEAAIDYAIANAMENHEETINSVEAYRDFADEENIGAIIDDRFEDELAERADTGVKNWLGDEVGNLSYIDVNGSIPFVKDDDGYCVLEGYRLYSPAILSTMLATCLKPSTGRWTETPSSCQSRTANWSRVNPSATSGRWRTISSSSSIRISSTRLKGSSTMDRTSSCGTTGSTRMPFSMT